MTFWLNLSNWLFSILTWYFCTLYFHLVKLTFTFFLIKFTFLNMLPDTCVLSRPTSLDSLKINHHQHALSYSIQTWKLVNIGYIENIKIHVLEIFKIWRERYKRNLGKKSCTPQQLLWIGIRNFYFFYFLSNNNNKYQTRLQFLWMTRKQCYLSILSLI